jgi:membrane-bound inhibitor of C-type lysozyme
MRHWTVLKCLLASAVLPVPAAAQTIRTYHCGDGTEFIVAFYTGDKTAHVQLDGKALALTKRISVSGSRYAKGEVTLRVTRAGTTLKRGRQVTECAIRK